jgi:succinate dehydrogenase / fumarate reductase cytochrome b subunit
MQSRALAFGSSVGQKSLAGVSGLVLLGWVCLHVLGSLSALRGPQVMDGYAELLRHTAGAVPLWGERIAFSLALGVHVFSIAQLARRAQRARPIGYRGQGSLRSAWAARWLAVSGLFLAIFLLQHVLALNFGVGLSGFVPGHVYANLVQVCRRPLPAFTYVVAAAVLGAHVVQGLRAAFVSLGAQPHARSARFALTLGLALALGFAAVPLAIAFGALS